MQDGSYGKSIHVRRKITMIADILFAGWFFLPAGIANVMPVFASRMPLLSRLSLPIDFDRTWRSKPIFGLHKTWRGIFSGIFAGLAVLALQKFAYANYGWAVELSDGLDYGNLPLLLGASMGFGALAGDAIKSFFKRQANHGSGDSWFPFDQLDYIIGGLLASLFFVTLEISQYIWIILIWFGLHLIGSFIGYKLKLKPKPI